MYGRGEGKRGRPTRFMGVVREEMGVVEVTGEDEE